MSALEDRIRAGLNADREVPDLWDAIQEGARRRRARRTVAAAAAVTTVVALVAVVGGLLLQDRHAASPAPVDPPGQEEQQVLDPDAWDAPDEEFLAGTTPSRDDLVGLWRVRTSDEAWLMLLGAHGYWTTTNTGDLFAGAGNRGTWSLREGRVTLDVREGFLGAGYRQVLDVALMADGSLHQVTRPDDGRCATGERCAPGEPERFLFDRVAPGDSLLLATVASASGSRLDPALVDPYVPGVWATTDGRWVVTVGDEGGFRAFRDTGDPTVRPDDTGRLAIDARGRVTLSCQGGTVSAEVVLEAVHPIEGLVFDGVRMRGQAVAGSCPSGLGETLDWIRVSG